MPKIYRVGGCVRDKIMELQPNDVDYLFVDEGCTDIHQSYENMMDYLRANGYIIFVETKKYFTVRCRKDKQTIDFTVAKKQVGYEEDTQEPIYVPATLYDDLRQRDYSINCIAEDDEGRLYDYFHGIYDIHDKVLRTPLEPHKMLNNTPLALIRAIRFKITRGFVFCDALQNAFDDDTLWTKMRDTVHVDRIREELQKCFKYDTIQTLEFLKGLNPHKIKMLFGGPIWLKPSL